MVIAMHIVKVDNFSSTLLDQQLKGTGPEPGNFGSYVLFCRRFGISFCQGSNLIPAAPRLSLNQQLEELSHFTFLLSGW